MLTSSRARPRRHAALPQGEQRARARARLSPRAASEIDSFPLLLKPRKNVASIGVYVWRAGADAPERVQVGVTNLTRALRERRAFVLAAVEAAARGGGRARRRRRRARPAQRRGGRGRRRRADVRLHARAHRTRGAARAGGEGGGGGRRRRRGQCNQLGGGRAGAPRRPTTPAHALRAVGGGPPRASRPRAAAAPAAARRPRARRARRPRLSFLPLPVHTRLPVHVNGYFGSSGRRDGGTATTGRRRPGRETTATTTARALRNLSTLPAPAGARGGTTRCSATSPHRARGGLRAARCSARASLRGWPARAAAPWTPRATRSSSCATAARLRGAPPGAAGAGGRGATGGGAGARPSPS